MYSTEGHLPPKVVFHQKLPSTEGRLPPKVVLQQRLSSTYLQKEKNKKIKIKKNIKKGKTKNKNGLIRVKK